MKGKLLKKIVGGLSFTTAPFVFQACYGTPQDSGPDAYKEGIVKSKSDDLIVVLTGGEPLLRKDMEECGREIRKRGVRLGMVSNGYLYNRETHVALLNAGMGKGKMQLSVITQ